jgi:hypothetical protein
MPQNIISSIISSITGSTKFSATNELTGIRCWTTLKIKDVEVDSASMNTSHPVSSEGGSDSSTYTSLISSDIAALKIIQPSKMKITAFCSDISSLEGVISVFKDTQATLSITTKGITASGMMVVDVDVEQTALMMSAMKVTIELEQAVAPASGSAFNPAQSTDSPNYGISIQTPPNAVASATGLYNTVSNYIGGL